MPKVSVVIPIYNVEKYLDKCLTSLASQTLEKQNQQIILVDDGSTDRSGEIAEQYGARFNNFEVYHTKNQGVSLSRKFGVSKAIGDYIGFVDADDYCDIHMFQRMLDLAVKNDLDIIACRNHSFSERGIEANKRTCLYEDNVMTSYRQVFDNVVASTIINGTESVVLWNKIYKKYLFTDYDVDFGSNILEDYLVNMQCYKHINRFMQISQPLYFYRVLSNSLSRSFKPEIFDRLIEIQERKEQIFAEEFELDNKLVVNADLWFLHYVESILKSLYLFGAKSFDKDGYAQAVLTHCVVVKKAGDLLDKGYKVPFAQMICNEALKQEIAKLKIYATTYKAVKKIKR